MNYRTPSLIAREGWPWLIASAAATLAAWRLGAGWGTALPAAITGWMLLLFRDPWRDVPPLPLAVLAPADGRVVDVQEVEGQVLRGPWWKITLATSHLGAYSVRAPIEGKILDVREHALPGSDPGLWLRSEEEDDVVLLFPRRRFGLRPRAFVRYGERVGQGERFAWLRLASRAVVYVPVSSRVQVTAGDRVVAGVSPLAELVHA